MFNEVYQRTLLKMHVKCWCNLMSIKSILNIRHGLLVKLNLDLHSQICMCTSNYRDKC